MNRLSYWASWILPLLGMGLAYTVLAWSSETDTTGKAWMAIGFAFVVVLWSVFRILVDQTALSRAVASADAPRILAIADKQLARRKDALKRGPFLVYRAYALEWQGDHAGALAALAEAKPMEPGLIALATAIRVLALAEQGDTAAARRTLDEELEPRIAKLDPRLHAAPHMHALLARGRLFLAEGKRDEAKQALQKVIDDIRAGAVLRERAKKLIA
jgi:tetratricopeptide (TPR) repeat protein